MKNSLKVNAIVTGSAKALNVCIKFLTHLIPSNIHDFLILTFIVIANIEICMLFAK